MNTEQQPAALTRQQLARYVGGQVMVVQPLEYRHGQVGILQDAGMRCGRIAITEGDERLTLLFDHADIRPVLRPVSAVSDAEWKAFFGECESGRGNGFTWVSLPGTDLVRFWDDGKIEALRDDYEDYSLPFNYAPLIDYLDEIGVDCRGYLQSGLAVAKVADAETANG